MAKEVSFKQIVLFDGRCEYELIPMTIDIT